VTGRERAVSGLHPAMAGIVFAHLANGDDVSIVDGSVRVEFGPNRYNADGPAIGLAEVDPDAVVTARFNGAPVDEVVLAALVRRALDLGVATADDPREPDDAGADTAR
jgi:hypothetical protein